MLKKTLKRIASRAGVFVANTHRLGLDVELDLARLTQASPLKTIFDVGANVGQSADRLHAAFPAARIFSFEPAPRAFAQLRQATASLPQVTAIHAALGETVGVTSMSASGSDVTNSLKMSRSTGERVEVAVDTVDHVCTSRNIDAIDLLKVDVEGFELQVLAGSRDMLAARRIRFVYAECITAPSEATHHTSLFDLHRTLESAGFCFFAYYAESFDLRQGNALGNVLYAHRSALPPSVSGSVHNIV